MGKIKTFKTATNEVSVGAGSWKLTVASDTNSVVAEFRNGP